MPATVRAAEGAPKRPRDGTWTSSRRGIRLLPAGDSQSGNDRYRRVERFTEGLFTKWDKFREPPRHPKWRDVNLAATVPGWNRWGVAEEMLKRIRPKDAPDPQVASGEFSAFLKDKGSAASANMTQEQREALFREFLQWRDKQRNATQR